MTDDDPVLVDAYRVPTLGHGIPFLSRDKRYGASMNLAEWNQHGRPDRVQVPRSPRFEVPREPGHARRPVAPQRRIHIARG